MKIRKHKNNKTFLITFQTHNIGRKARTSATQCVWATGSCKQSVLRAFLFGRDASNMTTFIREAKPLWAGRLAVCTINQIDSDNLLLPV